MKEGGRSEGPALRSGGANNEYSRRTRGHAPRSLRRGRRGYGLRLVRLGTLTRRCPPLLLNAAAAAFEGRSGDGDYWRKEGRCKKLGTESGWLE